VTDEAKLQTLAGVFAEPRDRRTALQSRRPP
jgi:hypothetical protein